MRSGAERGALAPSPSTSRVSFEGLVTAVPRALRSGVVVAVVLAAIWWTYVLVDWGFLQDVVAFDFRGTIWEPGTAILDGRSPYPDPSVAEVEIGNPSLYPPLLIVLSSPLTLLPWPVGAVVWTALLCGAVAVALLALDVRDLRCYALAFLSPVVAWGLVLGNATLLLLPVVALAWRWRGDWRRTGPLIGLAIASKLFLWPLVFWLVGTRRYRALGAAMLVGGASLLLPWAAIGFAGMSSYPDLLRIAEDVYAVHSFSVATILGAIGVETGLATSGAFLLGLVLSVTALVVARRGADSVSISLALLAAVLASPIAWPFYFGLLLIPLAIARPRFSLVWLALPLFYVADRLPRPLVGESDLEPGGVACCRPEDTPVAPWVLIQSPPGLWPALGYTVLAVALVAFTAWALARSSRTQTVR